MISIFCASCQKKLAVKDELAGKKVKCPGCGQAAVVPAAVAGPAPSSPKRCADSQNMQTLPPNDALPGRDQATQPSSVSDVTQPSASGDDHDSSLTDFLSPPQADDELGRLGGYRVLKILGHGGMGVVFRAQDPHLQRLVALKAMLPSLAIKPVAKERFFREARSAAALKHPHIVTIFQVGEDRGAPFLAMEHLEGEPLDERLGRAGKLPIAEVLRIGREVAQGLACAHEKGLIHRDIKPANIWLEGANRGEPGASVTGGQAKILDFGLARAMSDQANLTQSGTIVGTPAYMAPEQASGKKVDHRCDLFSLGCVLYRMCTGQMAFQGDDTIAILSALALDDPPSPGQLNPEVPAELSDLVMRLLAKKADERPESAKVVAEAIREIEEQASQMTARPVSRARKVKEGVTEVVAAPKPSSQPVKRKSGLPWYVGGGVLGLGVLGLLLFLLRNPQASRERERPGDGSKQSGIL